MRNNQIIICGTKKETLIENSEFFFFLLISSVFGTIRSKLFEKWGRRREAQKVGLRIPDKKLIL